jgi:restriction endonuclease Mrr
MIIDKVPPHQFLMWPVLEYLRKHRNRSVPTAELEAYFRKLGYPEEWHQNSKKKIISRLDYRLAWAFSFLRQTGCAVSEAEKVLQVTEIGMTVTPDELEVLRHEAMKVSRLKSLEKKKRKKLEDAELNSKMKAAKLSQVTPIQEIPKEPAMSKQATVDIEVILAKVDMIMDMYRKNRTTAEDALSGLQELKLWANKK